MEKSCNLFTIEKRAMELTINNYYKKCYIDYNKKTINNNRPLEKLESSII